MSQTPAISAAYWVLVPEASVRFDAARWETQARNFFEIGLEIADGVVRVAGVDVAVRVWPREQCDALLAVAREASASMGGFDVLVARTRSVLEVSSKDPKSGLLVAAIAASILLGPIVTPEGALLGVKSARARLAHLGQL
jgi:hypothetical protein